MSNANTHVIPAPVQNLFEAGNRRSSLHQTQLVFVSACHSEFAAEAFVAANVPHVVAVKLDSKVRLLLLDFI